ncbi:MAG TPA: aspartate aminotransferase family protein [Acidimicrobiales bacterium]|nr:aspartate aminotransferase family protein [Acidimicrobiales bacterium]
MPPHPLFFTHGLGSRLWDVDGHEYLDYVLGWGPLILGSSHPRIVEALRDQAGRGTTFGAGHHWEYEVAEQIIDIIPGVERVLWSNTGSEAVQVALRLARASTERQRFVKFSGHYHGWSDAVLLGYRSLGQPPMPESRGQSSRTADDVTLVAWNDVDEVRKVLTDPNHDIAAVLVEPVLCNSGVIAPEPGFLEGLRELCDETSTVLVFDEVITGFRVAYGGAVERFNVQPDLVVLGKAIAGGLPLSAVAGRGDLIDQVTAGVVHAGTLNGNPLVLAAAAATLDELGRPDTYESLERRAATLVNGIAAVFDSAGLSATVHNVGAIVQVTPTTISGPPTFSTFMSADWKLYNELIVAILRRGVFVMPGGRMYLSTEHSDDDIAATVDAFSGAVEEVVNGFKK